MHFLLLVKVPSLCPLYIMASTKLAAVSADIVAAAKNTAKRASERAYMKANCCGQLNDWYNRFSNECVIQRENYIPKSDPELKAQWEIVFNLECLRYLYEHATAHAKHLAKHAVTVSAAIVAKHPDIVSAAIVANVAAANVAAESAAERAYKNFKCTGDWYNQFSDEYVVKSDVYKSDAKSLVYVEDSLELESQLSAELNAELTAKYGMVFNYKCTMNAVTKLNAQLKDQWEAEFNAKCIEQLAVATSAHAKHVAKLAAEPVAKPATEPVAKHAAIIASDIA